MDKLHDLLGELQKIREATTASRQDLESSLNHLYNILTTITHDDQSDVFQSEAEELMADELIGTIAEFKARIEGDVGSFDDPDDASERRVVTDPETGNPKWSDESIGEHDATDDKENQNLGRFVTQTLLKKDLLKTDKYPEDMIGKFIENVLRRYESKVPEDKEAYGGSGAMEPYLASLDELAMGLDDKKKAYQIQNIADDMRKHLGMKPTNLRIKLVHDLEPARHESVKMSHVGKDVDQTLSYDNWLKQKKGILRGARGITGPEHNKFAKEYRVYKKK